MTISRKISLLVLFLIFILAVSTSVGLSQLTRVTRELNQVANKNNQLTLIITSITQHQLEKAVLFERIVRIAEELAFDDINFARKQHLLDHAAITKQTFDKLTRLSAINIITGKEIIQFSLKEVGSRESRSELEEAMAMLRKVEMAHIEYDQFVTELFVMIDSGEYTLDFAEIDRIQNKKQELSNRFDSLLGQIQQLTRKSLLKAESVKDVSQKTLWLTFWLSTLVGGGVAFVIVRSIARPLKKMENATHKIRKGRFNVRVPEDSRDEIGSVGRAFNMMTKALEKAQAELRQKNKDLADTLRITENQKSDLEKVNKELDNFVHTVSHDIRSPLSGISGYSTILSSQYAGDMDERGKKCVAGIRRGVQRMDAMISDLLALTRISRVKNPYELVNINEVIQEVLGRLEFKIQEHQVECDIRDDFPRVVCDRIKITEVFLNLINNGIKFSSKKHDGNPKIEVGWKETDTAWEFYVRDNGIGIAREDQEKVFGIFHRLLSATEYEGTGTGLTIVKGVVEDHNGRIWIDSEPGQGATFCFTIDKNLTCQISPGLAG